MIYLISSVTCLHLSISSIIRDSAVNYADVWHSVELGGPSNVCHYTFFAIRGFCMHIFRSSSKCTFILKHTNNFLNHLWCRNIGMHSLHTCIYMVGVKNVKACRISWDHESLSLYHWFIWTLCDSRFPMLGGIWPYDKVTIVFNSSCPQPA